MRGADIRLLMPADLDAAFALSATAGWNQRAEDWRMLLRLAPGGAFVAEADEGVVGTAIAIDYGRFAWIAMMLVDPAWRGRGLGARLLEAALEAVPAGRPVRLDATPLGRPLYERHGFADEAVLTRHTAGRPLPPPPEDAGHRRTRPLTDADMPRLLEVDGHLFAGSRGAVLEWARAGAPEYAHIVADGNGPQYCLGRQGRLFDQIGPVAASSLASAQSLVHASLAAAANRPVIVDAFDERPGFAEWLGRCGFTAQRPLFRMRRAGTDAPPIAAAAPAGLVEFAILGPEFA